MQCTEVRCAAFVRRFHSPYTVQLPTQTLGYFFTLAYKRCGVVTPLSVLWSPGASDGSVTQQGNMSGVPDGMHTVPTAVAGSLHTN